MIPYLIVLTKDYQKAVVNVYQLADMLFKRNMIYSTFV